MRRLFFCLLILVQLTGNAQTTAVDSLLRAYSTVKDDSSKWQILYKISEFYIPNNQDSAKLFIQETINLAKAKLPTKLSLSYTLLGSFHIEYKQYEKASEFLYKALDISEKEVCQLCKIEALNKLFLISYDKMEFEAALTFLRENQLLATKINDSTSLAKSLINTSLVFSQIPQNDSAIYYIEKSIVVSTAINNYPFLQYCYNNLGIVYQNEGAHRQSLQQFKKAAYYAKLANNKEMQATLLYNIGSAYEELMQYDSAIYYMDQSKILMEVLNRKDLLGYYFEGVAQIFKKQGHFKKALDNYELGVAINDSIQAELYGKNISDAEAKFKTQEIKSDLINKELELNRQTALRYRIIVFGIICLLLLTGVFQYFRNKDRLKKKEAELALQLEHTAAEKLREMDQLKSRFFANISHEFRTPLTLIQGPLHQAKHLSHQQATDEVSIPSKYIRMMARNVDRLLNLVNQLLDLSKLESGKMELNLVTGNPIKLIKRVVGSFESMAERKQIHYQFSMPDKPIEGWFDSQKLEKVLTNLLSNAFKFTPEEGFIKVFVKQTSNNYLLIEVADSGIGISATELPHIFERFYSRADNKVGSTGIGLALTKELVDLQNGHIEVQSTEGLGTQFSLFIPLTEFPLKIQETKGSILEPVVFDNKSLVKKQPLPNYISQNTNAPSEELPQVLVVEDNQDVQEYIADQLKDHYQVLLANNGKVGIEKVLQFIPDLIISDVMMPEMDGIEFCKQLKNNELSSHIPIILLTALVEQADKLEGLESGADSYLAKPFDPQELQLRVRKLIAQRKALQQHFQGTVLKLSPKEILVKSKDEQFLKTLMMHIEENMEDEDFGVEDLSKAVAMSRHQLHRKLKALTNQSISVFIRQFRLERAFQLLQQGAGNSSEVCFMVGFSSPAYFSKCFKDQFGKVPTDVIIK